MRDPVQLQIQTSLQNRPQGLVIFAIFDSCHAEQTFLDWKWSSGWLEDWDGLFLVTDVSASCAKPSSESSDRSFITHLMNTLFTWPITTQVFTANHIMGLAMATLSMDSSNCLNFPLTKIHNLTLKMASAQEIKASVANNSRSQDSSHPNDHFQSRYVIGGFKSFS